MPKKVKNPADAYTARALADALSAVAHAKAAAARLTQFSQDHVAVLLLNDRYDDLAQELHNFVKYQLGFRE